MEPDQAGAVESPGSLFPHRLCPACPDCPDCTVYVHGLHGLFSGRKRRATPTRRERVEQARPLLLSLACFPPSPSLPATKPAPQ